MTDLERELVAALREWVADCFCQQDSIRHPDGCGRCAKSRAAIARTSPEDRGTP